MYERYNCGGQKLYFPQCQFLPYRSKILSEVTFEQMMIYDDEKYTYNFYSFFL